MQITDKNRFECLLCKQTFIHESRYNKHYCNSMERRDQLKTYEGQQSWFMYQTHQRLLRRCIPAIETFQASRTFPFFYKFACFSKKLNIPDIEVFIKLMVRDKIDPIMWASDQVYVKYIEYIDRSANPMVQAKISVNTLLDLADALECENSEIFGHPDLTASDIRQLIRQRKLSIWLLAWSSKFKIYINSLPPFERDQFNDLIRSGYWSFKLNKPESADTNKNLQKIVKSLNI